MKINKQETLNCKCQSVSTTDEGVAVMKDCKCKPSDRKEREFNNVIVEKI